MKQATANKKIIIRSLLLSGLSLLAIALPWQIYILMTYPAEARYEYFHHWLHLASELEGHKDAGWWYYLDKIRINYSEIIYLPLLVFVLRLNKDTTNLNRNLALFIWIFIPLIFFSFAKTKMQGYILFISPALFMITADFFYCWRDLETGLFFSRGIKSMALFMQTAILVLPLRYCYERTNFGLAAPMVNPEMEIYKKMKFNDKRTVVLNVRWPIEFMFYTDCIAYRQSEISREEEVFIKNSGYKVKRLSIINTEASLQ